MIELDTKLGDPYNGDISKLKYYVDIARVVDDNEKYYEIHDSMRHVIPDMISLSKKTSETLSDRARERRLFMQNEGKLEWFENNFGEIFNNILVSTPPDNTTQYFFLSKVYYKKFIQTRAYYLSIIDNKELQSTINKKRHQMDAQKNIDKLNTTTISNNGNLDGNYSISNEAYNDLDESDRTNWEKSVHYSNNPLVPRDSDGIDITYIPKKYNEYKKSIKISRDVEKIRPVEIPQDVEEIRLAEEEIIPDIKNKPKETNNGFFNRFFNRGSKKVVPIGGGKRRTKKYKYKYKYKRNSTRVAQRKPTPRRTRRKQTKLK